ncbi:hypothetical protein [Brucella sp. 22210]|jgi:hypothetical protein|uniref:hypothetical protein n=1 Tax=Brucella sp. 22210 TaxID=3453892 RepID=UPI003F852EC9
MLSHVASLQGWLAGRSFMLGCAATLYWPAAFAAASFPEQRLKQNRRSVCSTFSVPCRTFPLATLSDGRKISAITNYNFQIRKKLYTSFKIQNLEAILWMIYQRIRNLALLSTQVW